MNRETTVTGRRTAEVYKTDLACQQSAVSPVFSSGLKTINTGQNGFPRCVPRSGASDASDFLQCRVHLKSIMQSDSQNAVVNAAISFIVLASYASIEKPPSDAIHTISLSP